MPDIALRAAEVSTLQRLGDLGRLVTLLAARNGSELNVADVSADGGFPARTLPPYLDLLETLYLMWRVPAWSTNLTQRVTARPKIVVLDSGLAAHQVNISAESMHPTRRPEPFTTATGQGPRSTSRSNTPTAGSLESR